MALMGALARLRVLIVPALALLVSGLGASIAGHDEEAGNLFFFAAWVLALFWFFALALRLPPRISGSRRRAALWQGILALAGLLVAWLANVAVFHHDVHFDLSREGANTPPPQLQAVVQGLETDVALTYFYNSGDDAALRARDLLTIAGRENGHFHVRSVDLDREPALARRFGVSAYNTAVLEAEDRRAVVENSADPTQIADAALRVLKKRVDVICFVTGHGEAFAPLPAHFHYSHVETLRGHDVAGGGDVLVGPPGGLDRLQLAVTTLGYATRAIVTPTLAAIPADCAVLAEIGPRAPYGKGEAQLYAQYLAAGGRLLVMFDPGFAISSDFAAILETLGLAADEAIVIDPLNHSGADDSKVAVPYYPPHPITDRVALTVFPDARPIELGAAPPGVNATVLVSSSVESYQRALGGSVATNGSRHPAILAVAEDGHWPEAPAATDRPFRLVLVGNSNFATNAYFPQGSNGELAVSMIRWLAGDEALPRAKPQSFALEQIELTNREMRDIFVAVELLLPLAVVLLGAAVWWRRR